MSPPPTERLGDHAWTVRTDGRLTPAERRSLLRPLARAHAANLAGRLALLTRTSSGRRAHLPPEALTIPSSCLTAAAEREARRRLPPVLLRHAFRTYAYARALGLLEDVDVDTELLFTAAMLHDVGLVGPRAPRDFTLAGARVARDVAEEVGLSSAATDTVRDAITMHHTPGVGPGAGAVAYLLAAGAGVDVVGLRAWQLPPAVLAQVTSEHPRDGFARAFTQAWRAEAAAVPDGRAQFLRRYGAFDLAVRLAPFPG